MTTASYTVDGMTCDHCVRAVTTELLGLDGVTRVDVELVPGAGSTVTVVSAAPLVRAAVVAAVDDAGYRLAGPGAPGADG